MFCDCDKVRPLWDNLSTFIYKKYGENLDLSNFQKMFGIDFLNSEHTRVLICLLFILNSIFTDVNSSKLAQISRHF